MTGDPDNIIMWVIGFALLMVILFGG